MHKSFLATTITMLFIFIFSPQLIYSQKLAASYISGYVTSSNNHTPIPDVNIYVAHTQTGTTTDKNGYFNIRLTTTGSYELIFSHVGFQAYIEKIRIIQPISKKLNVMLRPMTYQLPSVQVNASENTEWQDNYEIFKREFIGRTKNASLTKILNQYIINFKTDGFQTLFASADQPLEIRNDALGYKIIYVLESFEYGGNYVKYSGTPAFQELIPESEEQKQEWELNRKTAYLGSLRHFLTTISRNYFITGRSISSSSDDEYFLKEGFIIKNQIRRVINRNVPPFIKNVEEKFSLSPGEIETELKLNFSNYLDVTYLKEPEESNFLAAMLYDRKAEGQESWIILHADTVSIDISGRYYDEFMIQTFGYWAFERLADTLPNEYSIEDPYPNGY